MTNHDNLNETNLAAKGIVTPNGRFEDPLRPRDRKRRNQRIAAVAEGVAVFITVVLILISVDALTSGETPAVPGPAETEPAETNCVVTRCTETGSVVETGPMETAPTVTGPGIGNTGDPSSVGFDGLPPEGATPSKPLRGELVMKEGTGNALAPWYWVNVYADGRLIWSRQSAPRWIEQRLTPEGVELLRSGAVPLGGQFKNPAQRLPASAWEDPTLRPFVPWRYHACLLDNPSSLALDFLPAEAKDVLRRSPWTHATRWSPCREVTLEDARVLVEILSDAGFELIGAEQAGFGIGGFLMFTDTNGNQPPNYGGGDEVGIEFWIVLPHGSSNYGYGF
jgi:hypothetical protein